MNKFLSMFIGTVQKFAKKNKYAENHAYQMMSFLSLSQHGQILNIFIVHTKELVKFGTAEKTDLKNYRKVRQETFPVAISITTQPKLQMSAARPYPASL